MSLQEVVYILAIVFFLFWLVMGIGIVVTAIMFKRKFNSLEANLKERFTPSKSLLALIPVLPLAFRLLQSFKRKSS
jgi:hypothetical protein